MWLPSLQEHERQLLEMKWSAGENQITVSVHSGSIERTAVVDHFTKEADQ